MFPHNSRYRNSKSWIPFQCDDKCTRLYDRMVLAQGRVEELENKRDSLVREARSAIGIWSTIGVSEVRGRFWDAWERGKETAKRWTMMDGIFMMMAPGERERTIVHVFFKLTKLT